LKAGIARPRPSLKNVDLLIGEYLSNFSFPSGHATMAGAAFGFFRKRKTAILLALMVLGVMFSRVYLGLHYLTDVIAGAGIGIVSGIAIRQIEGSVRRRVRLSKKRDEIAIIAVLGLGLLAMIVFKPAPLLGILLGYVAGFFAFKAFSLKQRTVLGQSAAVKQAAGFAVLGIILASTQIVRYEFSFALYLLSGLWVSLLWPWVFEKLFK